MFWLGNRLLTMSDNRFTAVDDRAAMTGNTEAGIVGGPFNVAKISVFSSGNC